MLRFRLRQKRKNFLKNRENSEGSKDADDMIQNLAILLKNRFSKGLLDVLSEIV